MKRGFDILRAIIISPEVLFLSTFALIAYLKSDLFSFLASQINTNEETIRYLALIPPGIIVFLIARRDDLLFVEHSKHHLIQEWPNYHMLLDRYWICITWGIIGSFVTLSIWLFKGDLSRLSIFSIFVCGIITPIITVTTFFNATITIKRILFMIMPESNKH